MSHQAAWQRREVLRTWLAAAAALALPATRLWAVPTIGGDPTRLLVVLLRGAYDGLSAVVPYSEPFYYEARPNIAIPAPQAGDPWAAIRLDGRWGLHPMLADSAGDLFAQKQLAFVPFCGTGFVSRSHFQAQDWLEAGKLPEQRPSADNGFLNRLVQQLGGDPHAPMGFTQALPLALRGPVKVPNTPVVQRRARPLSAAYESQVLAMYQGHALEPVLREGLGLKRALNMELAEEMDASGRDAVSASGFALEAQRVARYMRDQPALNIGFMDVGGWDTHIGQGAAQGLLATRLAALGRGIEIFAQELGPQWRNTVVVVLSEFGRTFRENGSRGTDHGHGNLLWLAGGAVAGGKMVGEQTNLTAASLHQQRDMPVLNEYRAVLAEAMARMYGLSANAVQAVFPGVRPTALGLL